MPHIPKLIIPVGGKVGSRADVKVSHTTSSPGSGGESEQCSDESPVSTGSPRPGSSCYALREAVANLTFWDDFEAEKIGSGFYSDVYKIRHHGDGSVKVVKISKSRNNRLNQQKMLQELELLNKLHHPNVVRYMGACVKDGHIHPLLEFISGGSLQDVLKDQTVSLSWQQKASLATDIARGMEYLHSKNVCHRDLKSENCLIRKLSDDKLEAVVADFGLARVLKFDGDDRSPEQESPRRMSLVGSPFWMAPEILRGEEYTKTVDVFSFGIILCEIMARIPADPDDLPRTNLFGLDVDGFRKRCPDCPANMLQLAADCCSMDPTQRPSFTEIYHRICNVSHEISSPVQSKSHIPHTVKVIEEVNGNCSTQKELKEMGDKDGEAVSRTPHENSKEMNSVFDTEESISDESTTHECNSDVQNLAPRTSKTTQVMRALYVLSALSVLITLAILNFWQSIYTLIAAIVPLSFFILYPVTISNWWGQKLLTLKVSKLRHNLGRRLSWSNFGGNSLRESKVCDTNMQELRSGHPNSDSKRDPARDKIRAIDPKHDVFTSNTISGDTSKLTLSKDVFFNFSNEDVPTKPKVLCSRTRMSRTRRAGSFSLHDSIEEHADENKT